MGTNTAKKTVKAVDTKAKALEVSRKLKAMIEKNVKKDEKKAEGKGKVLDLKSKLKAKKAEGSVITNPKEREKLARYGIEVVVVSDADFEGGQAAEVRVDKDLVAIRQADREDAIAIAMGLYAHIKAQATKLAKQMAEE